MATDGEIIVVPFFGQGHLVPCAELCNHLSSRNFRVTLLVSSALSSSVPPSIRRHPLVEIAELPDSPPLPPPPEAAEGPGHGFPPGPGSNPFERRHQQMGEAIEEFLSTRVNGPTRPVVVVIDVMMSWSKGFFAKFGIPAVSFFTSGACAAAMEYAAWKANVDDIKPGEIRILPGLPEDMALTYSDVKRPAHGPPPGGPGGPAPSLGGPPAAGLPPSFRGPPAVGPPPGFPGPAGGQKFGPPVPGHQPPWLDEVNGSIAVLINTCDDLECPFIEYVANHIGIPVWGVGPLLPEEYWKASGSVLHDRQIRPNRQSNYTEDQVIQWLDLKPRQSVIYVSFGSEVGPTLEEYAQLADALAESNRAFIWVVQHGAGRSGPPPALLGIEQAGSGPEQEGYYPHGLDKKVGERGLIIHGWAPQLMILSHPSTAGFLSHCGWNSTVEAVGRGVPILAWPIRGDQFYDAKLVCHLKLGFMVSNGGPSKMVKKEEIVQAIERLMGDEEVRKRAAALGCKFRSFPASSAAALDAFREFVRQRAGVDPITRSLWISSLSAAPLQGMMLRC